MLASFLFDVEPLTRKRLTNLLLLVCTNIHPFTCYCHSMLYLDIRVVVAFICFVLFFFSSPVCVTRIACNAFGVYERCQAFRKLSIVPQNWNLTWHKTLASIFFTSFFFCMRVSICFAVVFIIIIIIIIVYVSAHYSWLLFLWPFYSEWLLFISFNVDKITLLSAVASLSLSLQLSVFENSQSFSLCILCICLCAHITNSIYICVELHCAKWKMNGLENAFHV